MNKLILCCFITTLIAVVASQQSIPGFPSYPVIPNLNDPQHPCNRPGANCNIQSRFNEESSFSDNRGNSKKWTQVCDEKGCREMQVQSNSTQLSRNFGLISLVAFMAFIKIFY